MERARLSLRHMAAEPPIPPICDLVAAKDEARFEEIDDRTTDYVLAVRDGFERLSDAARQMAALLILEASGAGPMHDHPVYGHAQRNVDEARERVGQARPTPRAAHHHRHLVQAIAAFDTLLARPDERTARSEADIRRPLTVLRLVGDHLRWASGALPGFEVVALGQGCGCCTTSSRREMAQA